MDRSSGRLPDPVAGAPNGERRRCVRQKLYTPVYASFNGPQTGMIVDLSELLDLHEEGFAVQTSERLEVNRAVTLCLDLPETRNFIHGCGEVVWSDDAGRGGIRFSALSESSRQILKEWLFANLLIGCSNHAARTEQLARREGEKSPEPVLVHKAPNVIPISERNEMLSSVEAVRGEIREIGDDVDAVFRLVSQRALTLTGASGAALAFLTDDKLICRARAGDASPPLGAPVNVEQGLSGECIRTGLLVSCEDMGNDPRVDPEIGRALGVGSLMAVPIMSNFRAVGLLEIFSSRPHGFTKLHGTVLGRLAEMIPNAQREQTQPETTQVERTQPETRIEPEDVLVAWQPPSAEAGSVELDSIPAIREGLLEREPNSPDLRSQSVHEEIVVEQIPEQIPKRVPGKTLDLRPKAPSRLSHLLLLGMAVAVVAMALGYLVGPIIEKRWGNSTRQQVAEAASTVSGRSMTDPDLTDQRLVDQHSPDQHAQARSVPDLRRRADDGDADAQWQLGVRYHDGAGVPQDDAQAVQWFQRAAEQGNVAAQGALGAYYWRGRGVFQDLSKAYFWSTIAMAQGDEISKSRLEGLASQMTRTQVSDARQRAEAWIRTHGQRVKSEAN
jgi:GAF domain/Sel1 repeat/PilZ domain